MDENLANRLGFTMLLLFFRDQERFSRRVSVPILTQRRLRREINEGLNIIEQWNSANDFIFFARHGEFTSNRREDHETSMLALHLL